MPGLQKMSNSQPRQLSPTPVLCWGHLCGFEWSSQGVTVGAGQGAASPVQDLVSASHTIPTPGQTHTEPRDLVPSTPSQNSLRLALQEMLLLLLFQAGPERCGSGFSILAPAPKNSLWGQGTYWGHPWQASPSLWDAWDRAILARAGGSLGAPLRISKVPPSAGKVT